MKWNDEAIHRQFERVKQDARDDGFNDEELSTLYLDGFTKLTKSGRILRLIRLAYWRGYLRGIRHVDEGKTPISICDPIEKIVKEQ